MFNQSPFSSEDALPPTEVRFSDLHVEPWPDGQRVRIHVEITPFQQRPNISAHIRNQDGDEIASTSVIETIDNKLVFTMHLRGPQTGNSYLLAANLFYEEQGVVDEREVAFQVDAPSAEEG